MSNSYRASDHKKWASAGLKDYGDFSDCITYCNQAEDYCDSLRGDWFYGDDTTRTIYSGSFANDHSPGSDENTWAVVYDTEKEYQKALAEWEEYPEYEESESDESEED
jgi:hypothetical protein